MTHEQLRAQLTEIFRDLFGDDDIVLTPELNADMVPGWDSIKQISLVVAVEEAFGIKLTTREVDGLSNVSDLEAVIAKKMAA